MSDETNNDDLRQFERSGGAPIEGPFLANSTPHRSLIPLRSTSGQGDKSAVVYFMPDGRVIVRYETEGYFDTGLRSQAFVIIRVNTDEEQARLEFIKLRNSLGNLMESAAGAFLEMEEGELLQRIMAEEVDEKLQIPYDETNPGTHDLGCDCIYCVPGN